VEAAPAPDDRLVIKAENYLYGRGVPRNCDQALVYLRAAAQQGSAKGHSQLGALYATGHCVPQDRAIAYKYFTQALGAGRGNIWVEHNRAMLWRQMTDEEKQRALR
jgi:TPR repeat protein